MNYKLMQRPMFRLGGNVRRNYQNGTKLSDIRDLIGEIGTVRDKAIKAQRATLPFQVLANQPGIESIRGIGDVVDILSGLPKDPNFFTALTKIPSLDLKMKEGELKDKLALAKLERDAKGSSTRLKSEKAIRRIQGNIIKLETQKGSLDKSSPSYKEDLRKINNSLKTEKAALRAFYNDDVRLKAYTALKQAQPFKEPTEEEIEQAIKSISGLADGGRVGFQEGTPDPTLPQPKPKGPMDDRKVENLMRAAPALENPGEVKEMAMKDEDVFAALRRRLPQEITDDVVRLIAYNPEAFADFADISDQSDVDSFNEKYNVQLVLPVENVT